MTGNPLRILHLLSHDRLKSGGALQAVLLARAQLRRGHEVRIVHNSGGDAAAAEAAFQPLAAQGLECRQVAMQHLWRFAGRRRLRALIAEFSPHVVHAHRERAVRFALGVLRAFPEPAFIAQKGNCHPSGAAAARAMRSARVDRIIAVAQAVKRALVLFDRVCAHKVDVVYGSFDAECFAVPLERTRARAELGLADATPLIGVLANLDRKKGHDLFFAAAARVLARRPDARFLVIGGGDVAGARAAARDLGVGDAVLFTGFRADRERLLAALDVSVNCSKGGEGLTGAIRESLALGCPVVCTNVGGNAELVENGESGLLVAPGDAASFAGAILHLLEHRAEAERMAREGQRRVREWMNDDVRCERVLSIYREILEWRAPELAARGVGRCLHPEAVLFRDKHAAE
ncbi:MAG: glycosyltransferase family 4 protein [Planctomycetes bacterium]|nr:glycosyltransferase family 4 protein [Planctomycetota bacterium]